MDKLQKAFNRLLEATKIDNPNELEIDGTIQRFEFTYELVWKTLKIYLEELGHQDTSSPKAVLKTAFKAQIITDDQTWLAMFNDRNTLTHRYSDTDSRSIHRQITTKYITAIQDLINYLNNHSE
ncbi:MAG: HI0074 family nucleotidyltransferase substrate-binding subunit [Methylacidiphilales bacterium]|nr:HI0074 family nucleotidyltransferase substrate-binding subunit [Candidatus Methylacidiphilales bacterium]